jgi:hypothetical protein
MHHRHPAAFLLPALLLFVTHPAKAGEGMWMPQQVATQQESDMRDMGMQMTAEDLYSLTHTSLKDAVVRFGGGCTGEVVSAQGLVLTNHHCGFNYIQALSTVQQNYLESGYWAANLSDELPCKGLTITFIVGIDDVTDLVLPRLDGAAGEPERERIAKEIGDSLAATATGPGISMALKSYYYGNRYYKITSRVFRDIRLVGAPPLSVGRFGGETDNWRWPRHSCDFAAFRIYAGRDNQPADYSADNVPFRPDTFLTISLGGVHEGDFTLVYGFPGTTRQYLPAAGLEMVIQVSDPDRIRIRQVKLDHWKAAMDKNDTIRLQYAGKYKSIANYYKKWQGELEGLRNDDVLNKKTAMEADMKTWIDQDPVRKEAYGSLLDDIGTAYSQLRPLTHTSIYISEAGMGIEALGIASRYRKLVDLSRADTVDLAAVNKETSTLLRTMPDAFANYNRDLDLRTGGDLLDLFSRNVSPSQRPWIFDFIQDSYDDYGSFLRDVFRKSIILDTVRLRKLLLAYKPKHARQIVNDPLYDVMKNFADYSDLQLSPELNQWNGTAHVLQREYMQVLMQMDTSRQLWPEANSTLRISYGKVRGMQPRDGLMYAYRSTLQGMVEKSYEGNPDYAMHPVLAELAAKKDFGRYGENGVLPVTFLSSCHTTGGNSGSPVLNARGHLVGINFDGVWEGLTTDYAFNGQLTNNISVDIRYVLFVMEKLGHADRLIGELKMVQD